MLKKKYPEIKPEFIKDEAGKTVGVCLPYAVYESILEEITELQKTLKRMRSNTKRAKKPKSKALKNQNRVAATKAK